MMLLVAFVTRWHVKGNVSWSRRCERIFRIALRNESAINYSTGEIQRLNVEFLIVYSLAPSPQNVFGRLVTILATQ